MLNFENPASDEELENTPEPQTENEGLFTEQEVEYPHTLHHTQENAPSPAAAKEAPEEEEFPGESTPEETVKKPATLRTISLPHYGENGESVSARRPFSHKSGDGGDDGRKAGTSRILAAARAAAGLTQVEVEERTKVRAFYIEALENGNFDQLPQQVYVLAYLRRLGELYGIKGNELEALLEPWKDIPCEIPENLPASVYPDPDNPNRKTLKKLEIGLYTAGAILVIGVVALVIMLVSSWLSGTRNKEGNPPFDREILLTIQPKPALTAPPQPKAK